MTRAPVSAADERGGDFVAALHGVRGLAVVIVVMSHLGNMNLRLLPVPHDAVGKVGVWLFFGLSAFLLTRRLQRALAAGQAALPAFAAYAVHRIFRIYPLFLAIVAVHVALGDLSWRAGLGNAMLAQGWEELWAIPVECRYYVVIPIVAWLAVRVGAPAVRACLLLALGVAAAAVVGAPQRVFSNDISLLPRLAPFLLGSWLALRPPAARLRRAASIAEPALLALALAAGAFAYRRLVGERLPVGWAPWLSIFLGAVAAWIIAAAQRNDFLRRAFAHRGPVWLGEVSFGLYLAHMFAIRAVLALVPRWPAGVQAWSAVAVMMAFATLLHVVLERPGIRAGRRLADALAAAVRSGSRSRTGSS